MKQKLILLFMLFFSFHLSFSQGKLTGKVIDAEEGDPLIGATVIIKGTTTGTATALDGSFTFKVKPGDHIVEVTYVGYIKKDVEVSVRDGEVKDMGTIEMEPDAIGLDEVKVVASFAKDRETPVAVSKVEPLYIQEKLGTKQFPEILETTPSVYATKQGGGFGDGRIAVRGFDSRNVGVLINGVPVNDMENGRVYWSNWAGLSDVTRTMQVQRGLGASRLAISSVGGTINIVSKGTDAQRGGSVYLGFGHHNYNKKAFSLSSGLMDNGWAFTLSASQESGDGFVKATQYESFTYFANISKRLNDNHNLSLTAFGAPQEHGQRGSPHYIQYYRDHEDGIRLNSDYGYRNGEIYNGAYSYNKYHKPMFILNHYWDINNTTSLSTAAYASFGNGGGRRIDGEGENWLSHQYPSGEPYEGVTQKTPEGYLDFDYVIEQNAASETGSKAIVSMSENSHDWYGLLSTFNTKFAEINITGGFDGRYYVGNHVTRIDDLMGGSYFLDNANVNRRPGKPLEEGDIYSYHNDGEIFWAGLFAQAEYTTDKFSGFLTSTLSNNSYRRIDYFQYFTDETINQINNDPELREDYIERFTRELGDREDAVSKLNTAMEGQKSDWVNFLDYSIKGGLNFNFTERQNVFVNGGYFTRAPFFRYVFLNYTNEVNEGVKHERVLSTEGGWGYRSKQLKADVIVYRTAWLDKALTQGVANGTVNLTGLNAIHQGIEIELAYKPFNSLEMKGMASFGDWEWQDDITAAVFDEDQNFLDSLAFYAGGIHVGNSAQTTAAFEIDYNILPDLRIGATFKHYADIYADFEIESRTNKERDDNVDSWEMPDYQLIDLSLSYYFKIAGFDASLYGNVDNLLNTEYISDANDGADHSMRSASVYYGWGRTWSAGLRLRF